MDKVCLCTWCGNATCVINIIWDDGNHIGDDDVSENLPEISDCFDFIDCQDIPNTEKPEARNEKDGGELELLKNIF